MTLNIPVIAIIGSKETGKTLVAEILISRLVKDGKKVVALKSIHHENFSIDKPGKDTWRMTQAGASLVISVAPKEIATIRRLDAKSLDLDQLMALIGSTDSDIIVMEGFHWLIARNEGVYKILTSRKVIDSIEILKALSPPVLAITYLEDKADIPAHISLPTFHLLRETDELMRLVKERVLHQYQNPMSEM